MGKHLLYFISLIIVAGAGAGLAQDEDPSLVAWWKLDGDLQDASGNGHHGGTFTGDAHFEAGLFGQALALDGTGDYVTINGYTGVNGTQSRTATAWIKTSGLGAIVAWGEAVNGQKYIFRVQDSNGQAGAIRVEVAGGYIVADTDVRDGQWHHVAAVIIDDGSPNVTEILLYLDGEEEGISASADEPIDTADTHDVWIGFDHSSRPFPGLIDELRIYDRALTADEIMALALRPAAYGPSPADGAVGVGSPLFSWLPRQTAIFHDVYLGTTPELGPDQLVAPGLQMLLYWHPPGLEPGTTYYWRVDEIEPDGTIYTGDVWSFFATPLEAWQESPIDGAPFTEPNVTLSWVAGNGAVSHDVYFGADETEVAGGAGDTFKGNQFELSYVTGDLEMDTTYYWRIDQVDAAGNKVAGNVWSFKTVPVIPVEDPSLMLWWMLDEGMGSLAVDRSGHDNHGTINGDAQWVLGYQGTALLFGQDVYVEAAGYPGVTGTDPRTLCAWIKTDVPNTNMNIMSWGENVTGQKWRMRQDTTGGLRIEVNGGYHYGVTSIGDGNWHHVAVTFEDDGTPDVVDTLLYVDGRLDATLTSQATDVNTAPTGAVRIGESPWHNSPWQGLIDDARVYNKVLTAEDLRQVMRGDPLAAWDLLPPDGRTMDIRDVTSLSWQPGDKADEHDVYLGTDFATVFAADAADATGVYRGRQAGSTYVPPEGFTWGTTYYWRIDEVNTDGTITTGGVRSFFVADYLIIDDFESYTNESPNRAFQHWVDGLGFSPDDFFPDGDPGNGSTALVGYDIWSVDSPHYQGTIMETDDVYSGAQAMPVEYNNALTPWYAEATRTWTTPQNWLFNDVDTLVIHFKGAPVDFLQTAPDSIVMSAAGTDIWGTADQFRYVYKQLNGDGQIIARIDSIVNTHVWAKGGVMIRESLEAGSRHAMVVVTPGSGVAFQRRLANNDTSVTTTEASIAAPHWVKLTRTGNELTAQRSADGVTWVDVGPDPAASTDTVVMGGSVYIGLALTSHSAGVATTAEFSGIATSGGVSGQWQMAEIGADHPGNAANTLYVAVEDMAGSVGIVTHPDGADAVLNGQWQQWPVDLDELAGVNLLSVKKMSMGIGDRTNPQVDGGGQMLFDDFRLTQGVPADPNAVE